MAHEHQDARQIAATHTQGRCRKCEKVSRHATGVRHVYAWKRSRTKLLRDARCPGCGSALYGTSHELQGPITRHGEPNFINRKVRGK